MTIKPAPWAVNRAAVAPEYQRLWDKLAYVWVGSSMNHPSGWLEVNTPTEVISPHGTVVDFVEADRDAYQLPGAVDAPKRNANAASAFVFASVDTVDSELISLGDDFVIRADRSNQSNSPVGSYRHSTFWHLLIHPNPIAGTGWRKLTYRASPGLQQFTIDGETAQATESEAIDWGTLGSDLFIGRHGNGSTSFDLDGRVAVAYFWDRYLSDSDIILLEADPFGLIRPATVLEVDIGPHVFFEVTDLPTDFGNAETAEIVVRTRGVDIGATPLKLFAQLFQSDEATSLSDEVEVASHTSDSSFANSSPVTFTGLNTTADKSVWDNARVRFRWGT